MLEPQLPLELVPGMLAGSLPHSGLRGFTAWLGLGRKDAAAPAQPARAPRPGRREATAPDREPTWSEGVPGTRVWEDSSLALATAYLPLRPRWCGSGSTVPVRPRSGRGHKLPDGPSGRHGGLPVHRLHEGSAGHRLGELGWRLPRPPPRWPHRQMGSWEPGRLVGSGGPGHSPIRAQQSWGPAGLAFGPTRDPFLGSVSPSVTQLPRQWLSAFLSHPEVCPDVLSTLEPGEFHVLLNNINTVLTPVPSMLRCWAWSSGPSLYGR